jgi:hypothetical protein
MEGEYPIGGGKMLPVCAVNAGTISVPQEGLDLSKTEIKYFDMLHDKVEGGFGRYVYAWKFVQHELMSYLEVVVLVVYDVVCACMWLSSL